MNSRLRRKFNQVEKQINDIRSENIRYYYKIGQIVLDIKLHPDDYVGQDGTPGIKLLEVALSTQARTLRNTATFAELYTPEAVEILIGMHHAQTNFRLHWGHIKYLLTVADADMRSRYAIEAVDKLWDPDTLYEQIKIRENRSGGHGRSHLVPPSVQAQVRQIRKLTQQWVSKNEAVWNGSENNVFNNVMGQQPDQMDPEILDDLRKTQELMEQMIAMATEDLDVMGRVIEYVDSCIAGRAREIQYQNNPATHTRSSRPVIPADAPDTEEEAALQEVV